MKKKVQMIFERKHKINLNVADMKYLRTLQINLLINMNI